MKISSESGKEGNYFLSFLQDRPEGVSPTISLCLPLGKTVINYEDWEAGLPLDILHVGRFTIHPPWKPLPRGEGIPLTIDPGVAFGSGYHASTRGCLILLDKLFERVILERVLELGTGTGILSIAALKMGAKSAMALDYNNLAIETARRNRAINGMDLRMHLWVGEAEKIPPCADRSL
jgi:ribosomal protein L11 methyltransferase